MLTSLPEAILQNSLEKLTASLADVQIDLTPYQMDAALFAFHSLFSKGAILADLRSNFENYLNGFSGMYKTLFKQVGK